MEVILIESVNKLGGIGDVVTVKNGYARNFLIPQKKALYATKNNIDYFKSIKDEIAKNNQNKLQQAEKVAVKVENSFVVIVEQAGDDGRLYGSVSTTAIAKAFSDEFEKILSSSIDRKQISLLSPIKELGIYEINIELHPELVVSAYVNVARTEEEAEDAKKEFLNPKKKKVEEEVIPVAPQKVENNEVEEIVSQQEGA